MTVVRLTNQEIEAVILPTSQNARLSQQHVEVIVLPPPPNARLTQQSIEVLISLQTGFVPQATIV